MANSLGTLSTGTILSRALELAFAKRPLLNQITTNFSTEVAGGASGVDAQLNDVVKARVFTKSTVTDFTAAATDVTATDVSVTLSNFKKVHHKFTATEINAAQTGVRRLIDEVALPMAVGLGDHLVDAVAALITAGNYTNATTDASPGFDTLVAIRQALNAAARGTPDDGTRFGIVNSATYAALLVDPLCNRQYKNVGADPTRSGELDQLAGFATIDEFANLPTTGNLTGFFGHKSSLVFASRIPKDPRVILPNVTFPGTMEVIRIENGFSVLGVEFINPADLSAEVYLAFIYGVARGVANYGQRLISA